MEELDRLDWLLDVRARSDTAVHPPGQQVSFACSLFLSLDDSTRATVLIGARGARLVEGDARDREDGRPTCQLLTTRRAWQELLTGSTRIGDERIRLLGDVSVLEKLGELLRPSISPLSLRCTSMAGVRGKKRSSGSARARGSLA